MGIFTDEMQKTSVSLYIERLSNLEEVDWYLLQQLTESIQMQESGPREAIETVRKKLKHGGSQQKLRVLEILKLLMENSNQQFHRQFLANEKMKERFELILSSPAEDPKVKKELISLLGAWSVKYKNEPGMRAIGDLYAANARRRTATRPRANTDSTRGASPPSPVVQSPIPINRQIESPSSVPSSPVPTTQIPREQKRKSLPPPSRPSPPSVEQPKPKNKPRSQSSGAASSNRSGSGSGGNRVFNFEKAKPKIIEEIAVANQNSNNLVNALKLINTSEERWEIDLQHDKRLQEYRDKCEESKKRIVRYARLVENEEWIGTLLATNEELLKALDMYDVMLVGEVPAAWLLAQQNQQAKINYYEQVQPAVTSPAPKLLLRAPPPPPPPNKNRLSLQLDNMHISRFPQADEQQQDDEDLDPFADPATPIEDENRRGYIVDSAH